ncbi:bifunctional [glutamine synthetase] adenylyltransferase/[glutamine synthetase]-adenylyl-L-tyrosine phosphorylase [Schaalia suimastitidis]|uniref:bifunctional [glutamine synthetase] adenylyltransferase/[glutamine synthetase]-adenylyl-L-tyrosine phosphorylase n=1 Tax=Schaalia suimastitidis TaxID=121163 RepID=UPI0004271AA4|nr:bifunctional [glutamine synthetase] adenylyltransferase/[glutamine synthetase]-adenylyl-L-tyrosine phosphorylase [Schaalia suimastitidis]
MSVSKKDLRAWGFAAPEEALASFDTLPGGSAAWAQLCGRSADSELALLQLCRLAEAAPDLVASLSTQAMRRRHRLVKVLGASRWWGDYLIAKPARCTHVWTEPAPARDVLLSAVGITAATTMPVAAPGYTSDDVRRAYRKVLIDIVADDLTADDPCAILPDITRRLSDLADSALEAALALARRDIDPEGHVRLAIIAMGKTGARELNYISDVDVMYVAASNGEKDEQHVLEVATRLAALTAQTCSGAGQEPPLWTVDPNLRPEGRNGALVRTLDSYRQYWDKWAQTWEFQALLKARPCAGDRELGQEFQRIAAPYVWSAAGRPGFVDDTRAMRLRVEQNIAQRDQQRELKLGRGGLRDVEFSVQLLQLVHGRTDESLRVPDTISAIGRLSDGGYIARSDAAELGNYYRFLRAVEHRAQLPRMRRTHLLPTSEADLRAMARSLNMVSAQAITDELNGVRQRVRRLHEDIFYRPIVAAIARMSPDEAVLDRGAAKDRLAAIGYVDTEGALAHITALTKGTTRRATIQRHLLPVFISWLADGADPDLGLLNFRSLSETIGDSHWYLALLRDSGVAAWRLCQLLPNARWIAQALHNMPEAVEMLDDDELLAPRDIDKLRGEMHALVSRHVDAQSAAARIRAVRTREMTRSALADALEGIDPLRYSIAEATDVALEAALAIAQREEKVANGRLSAHVALVAMGRYGGKESSYASDADILAVHRVAEGATDEEATACATRILGTIRTLLGASGVGLPVAVDVDLRPEGRSGVMSRSVDSYREYYDRWASAWERQALLRARPVAGESDILDAFFDVVNVQRYQRQCSEADLKDIRLLKARMEAERLPRGIDPKRHVKLGPGGLSDVEWVVQLLQMRYAHVYESLRLTSTPQALKAMMTLSLIDITQYEILRDAWYLATRIRAGNVLASGRSSGVKLDVLPSEVRDLVPLARILGMEAGAEKDIEQRWLRASRRCRDVMDDLFWTS